MQIATIKAKATTRTGLQQQQHTHTHTSSQPLTLHGEQIDDRTVH